MQNIAKRCLCQTLSPVLGNEVLLNSYTGKTPCVLPLPVLLANVLSPDWHKSQKHLLPFASHSPVNPPVPVPHIRKMHEPQSLLYHAAVLLPAVFHNHWMYHAESPPDVLETSLFLTFCNNGMHCAQVSANSPVIPYIPEVFRWKHKYRLFLCFPVNVSFWFHSPERHAFQFVPLNLANALPALPCNTQKHCLRWFGYHPALLQMRQLQDIL